MSVVVPSKLFDLERCVAAMAYQKDPASVSLPAVATRPRRFVWHRELHPNSPSKTDEGTPSKVCSTRQASPESPSHPSLTSPGNNTADSMQFTPPKRANSTPERSLDHDSTMSSNAAPQEGWAFVSSENYPLTQDRLVEPRVETPSRKVEAKDVSVIVAQVNCTWEAAAQALRRHRNDLVAAIIELSSGDARLREVEI
eukprot:TRINITY_DN64570_c0_g1_i1.p1 TRINITY_DN64570_c0_g1~~TRINITY_DN64570_c0_g1_i1.p1  ORF type:complete len:198 (-),score=25.38 TRINITY_DN64570_c0_g1_i1:118-711(-)